MKFEITFKDVPTKELITNNIVDEPNMIDVVVETFMRKYTIIGWFVVIENYYAYPIKEDYVIENLHELSI